MSEQIVTMAGSHKTSIDDETLARQVHRVLEDIKPLCVLGCPLHIQVNAGVVTLRGVVATYLDKLQIVQAVCSVPGVQQVSDELWV